MRDVGAVPFGVGDPRRGFQTVAIGGEVDDTGHGSNELLLDGADADDAIVIVFAGGRVEFPVAVLGDVVDVLAGLGHHRRRPVQHVAQMAAAQRQHLDARIELLQRPRPLTGTGAVVGGSGVPDLPWPPLLIADLPVFDAEWCGMAVRLAQFCPLRAGIEIDIFEPGEGFAQAAGPGGQVDLGLGPNAAAIGDEFGRAEAIADSIAKMRVDHARPLPRRADAVGPFIAGGGPAHDRGRGLLHRVDDVPPQTIRSGGRMRRIVQPLVRHPAAPRHELAVDERVDSADLPLRIGDDGGFHGCPSEQAGRCGTALIPGDRSSRCRRRAAAGRRRR